MTTKPINEPRSRREPSPVASGRALGPASLPTPGEYRFRSQASHYDKPDRGYTLTVTHKRGKAYVDRVGDGEVEGVSVYEIRNGTLVQVESNLDSGDCVFSAPAVVFSWSASQWTNDYICDRGEGRQKYRVTEVVTRGKRRVDSVAEGDCVELRAEGRIHEPPDAPTETTSSRIVVSCFSLSLAVATQAVHQYSLPVVRGTEQRRVFTDSLLNFSPDDKRDGSGQ